MLCGSCALLTFLKEYWFLIEETDAVASSDDIDLSLYKHNLMSSLQTPHDGSLYQTLSPPVPGTQGFSHFPLGAKPWDG